MTDARTARLASAIVLSSGIAWGLYWLPLREIEALGLSGAWATLAITLAALAALLPVALRGRANRAALRRAQPVALASVALAGAAFALFSIGLSHGRVALVTLMWYLSPVWAVLLTRLLLGWPVAPRRMAAVGLGLLGLVLMLGAGDGVPLPATLGEGLSLLGGLLWAVATTGIRISAPLPAAPSTLVFVAGAAALSLLLTPALAAPPTLSSATIPALAALALLTGGLWWGLATVGLLWAAARLDPARVSLLMMTEVLVGAASAALIAGEGLHPAELIGGALVLAAGVLEVWPEPPDHPA